MGGAGQVAVGFWVLILWFLPAICAAGPRAVKARNSCTSRELSRQDCRLAQDTYDLRLLKDTVAWNDGTWHTVDDLPLKGEGIQWEKATFNFINGWPILQLWIWDAGVGENKVQSLHWYVADAERRRFTILAEGIVRKRRLKSVPKAKPAEMIFDAMEPHALKPLKNGSLEWTLKTEKKLIERK